MKKWEEAEKDYLAGMKYKDIAAKYGVSVNTVKSWKSRHGWARGAPTKKSMHPKTKKVAPKNIDGLEDNPKLTENQKMFCLYYLQRFNATWAYQKAYHSSYEVANVEGSKNLVKPSIKKQLAAIKKQLHTDAYLKIDDIINEYKKQAFASLGDVLDYTVHKELVMDTEGNVYLDTDDNPVERHVSDIFLKPSDQIDWSLVQDIHKGKDGLVVKLYDKQKALDSLMKYFDSDMSKAQQRKVNAEADIAQYRAEQLNGVADENQDDGFIDAIDNAADTVWGDDDEN